MRIKLRSTSALTLVEALVVVGVLVVLVLLLMPALSRPPRGHAPRIHCINNLKQVGLAHLLWANDYGGPFPFASTNREGSRAWINSPEVFRHYLAISNELVSPKILACRADESRKRVEEFSKLSNQSLSYFVGLDAHPADPRQILSGDRNITGGTLSNGFLRVFKPGDAAGWNNDLHKNAGNIGLADGSVQQVTPVSLTKHLAALTNTTVRLATP